MSETHTGQRPHEDTHSLYASPPPSQYDRGVIVAAARRLCGSHLASYETHIRTPRGSVARLRLNISSPPRTRELRHCAGEAAKEGGTPGSPARCMSVLEVGSGRFFAVWLLKFTSLPLSPVLQTAMYTQQLFSVIAPLFLSLPPPSLSSAHTWP